jgi:hypothetical protein
MTDTIAENATAIKSNDLFFISSSPQIINAAPLQAAQMYLMEKKRTLKKRNINFFSFLVSLFMNFSLSLTKNAIDFSRNGTKHSRCNRNHCDHTAT